MWEKVHVAHAFVFLSRCRSTRGTRDAAETVLVPLLHAVSESVDTVIINGCVLSKYADLPSNASTSYTYRSGRATRPDRQYVKPVTPLNLLNSSSTSNIAIELAASTPMFSIMMGAIWNRLLQRFVISYVIRASCKCDPCTRGATNKLP